MIKEVRPTSGRVLGALFNILGPLEGRAFLDLFAGTGRVGLEAKRRGAEPVVWVESVRARAQAIEAAAGGVAVGKRAHPCAASGTNASCVSLVLSLEVRRAVSWLLKREMAFDVIFADPPYHDGWGEALLGVKGLEALLRPAGVLAVEHSAREPLALTPGWELASDRDYGETRLAFLRHLST